MRRRRGSRGPASSWRQRQSAPHRRSRRRPDPTCREACPPPGTRGGPAAGGLRREWRPARTRRAPARRGRSRRLRTGGSPPQAARPLGWPPWPRSKGLGVWARSTSGRDRPSGRFRVVKRYQWGRHSHPRWVVDMAVLGGWSIRAILGGCETAAMELHDAIRRRAMVRSFSTDPVDRPVVDRLVEGALRSPTAGNTGGTAWVVLEGAEETAVYFDATTDEDWRAHYRDWIDGLRARTGRAARLHLTRRLCVEVRRAGQGRRRAGRGRRPLAGALLVRRRGLRSHGCAARRRGRRVGRVHPRHVPRRGGACDPIERPARVAPLLRRRRRSPRRPGPPVGVARSTPSERGGSGAPRELDGGATRRCRCSILWHA